MEFVEAHFPYDLNYSARLLHGIHEMNFLECMLISLCMLPLKHFDNSNS
jgi:hypothetical protein